MWLAHRATHQAAPVKRNTLLACKCPGLGQGADGTPLEWGMVWTGDALYCSVVSLHFFFLTHAVMRGSVKLISDHHLASCAE